MARRKRQFLSDDDSSSNGSEDDGDFDDINDPDLRAERALHDDPYQRKRRRRNGKDDATYGVFGEDSEDEGFGKPKGKVKRSDWTKAPAFQKSGKDSAAMDVDGDGDASKDEEADSESESGGEDREEESDEDDGVDDGLDASKPPSPRVREEEPEDEPHEELGVKPRMGGIGFSSAGKTKGTGAFSASTAFGKGNTDSAEGMIASAFSKGGIGSSKGGIGSSKGGIGSGSSTSTGGLGSSKAGLGTAGGGLGFSKAGTTTPQAAAPSTSRSPPPPSPPPTASPHPDLPQSFSAPRTQRAFVRTASPAPAANLSAHEAAHFASLGGSFGARMLAKMGWQAGTGLGTSGEGIVTPIESKLRPQKMGIAFKGFKEKTAQSKAEARRRGEAVSSDEERPRKGGKGRARGKEGKEGKREDVWKRPKKVKTRVEHKTYEQIVAEAGAEVPPAAGIGQIIDATGATPREVASLADVSLASWTPSTDPSRIPEVRHNLRLIGDACKADLDGLAREARAIRERKAQIAAEGARLRRKVADEAELIARLQQVHLVVEDISAQAKELAGAQEATLEPFQPLFFQLVTQFPAEFERYRLDEVVVAAIAPVVRRMVAQWDPLKDPTAFTTVFRSWRQALRIKTEEPKPPETQLDVYGAHAVAPAPALVEKPMSPYESLLWHVWLPRVRSTLNNHWDASDPQPAVRLYEAWASLLPPFVRDNLLDQVVLPKVSKTVADWKEGEAVSLQALVFPWLPHVGLRLEEVLGEAKRKVRSLLRSWAVGDPVPKDLGAWREIFTSEEWTNMHLKHIVPKLSAHLRDTLVINPRAQDYAPLEATLAWHTLLRPSVLSQILAREFIPKWLDTLHIWLIQPRANLSEVADWYDQWGKTLGTDVMALDGVRDGMTRGLDMMHRAMALGDDAPTKLEKPVHDFSPVRKANGAASPAVKKPPARTQEITFRSIVEAFLASHDLLLVPTGRAHERSRMPLFRVSAGADGRGGTEVYLLDDAVWAPSPDAGDWRAIGLEDLVMRAGGAA